LFKQREIRWLNVEKKLKRKKKQKEEEEEDSFAFLKTPFFLKNKGRFLILL
tara:strand:- start:69 stop:221 length:153 start_codon:yes stop_codon:yes gene_type:complete